MTSLIRFTPLIAFLVAANAFGLECSPQQVDQALRSVTQGQGLIAVKKKDNEQLGSCFVRQVDDIGFTVVAVSGEEQERLDCEVVLFPGVKMKGEWKLQKIDATPLNSVQVSVNSGARISGANNLVIRPAPIQIVVDEDAIEVEEGEEGQVIVVQTAEMDLLVWLNQKNAMGTLTIKSLTFNQDDCKELRTAFEKL